jgi:hypothetical protein
MTLGRTSSCPLSARAVERKGRTMGDRTIWIGDPFDPDFVWRKPRPERSVPRAISPPLPAADRLWQALGRRFEAGQLSAHQTPQQDWIGLASRRELEALIEEAFPAGADDDETSALRAVIGGLDPRTIYYLVAARAGPDEPGGR